MGREVGTKRLSVQWLGLVPVNIEKWFINAEINLANGGIGVLAEIDTSYAALKLIPTM